MKGQEGKEFKAGIRRQEQKLRPCRNIAYWLRLHSLQGLISYSTPEHLLGMTMATVDWAFLPHQSLIGKFPTDFSTGQYDGSNSSTKTPASWYDAVCVNKKKKKPNQHRGGDPMPGNWITPRNVIVLAIYGSMISRLRQTKPNQNEKQTTTQTDFLKVGQEYFLKLFRKLLALMQPLGGSYHLLVILEHEVAQSQWTEGSFLSTCHMAWPFQTNTESFWGCFNTAHG